MLTQITPVIHSVVLHNNIPDPLPKGLEDGDIISTSYVDSWPFWERSVVSIPPTRLKTLSSQSLVTFHQKGEARSSGPFVFLSDILGRILWNFIPRPGWKCNNGMFPGTWCGREGKVFAGYINVASSPRPQSPASWEEKKKKSPDLSEDIRMNLKTALLVALILALSYQHGAGQSLYFIHSAVVLKTEQAIQQQSSTYSTCCKRCCRLEWLG